MKNLKKWILAIIFFLIAITIIFFIRYKHESPNTLTREEKDTTLDELTKRHFGESAVRIKNYDEEKYIYKVSGMSGDLEPIYFWHQLLPSNTESNFPSQQLKRDAVDFWSAKDRTVYYVNCTTGEEELLSDDINSMERLFEEEWYLKIECKSDRDLAVLSAELEEWKEYAQRRSPYTWEWGIGFSEITKAHLLRMLRVTNPAEDQANALLKEMSLEEKVGQMFIARCPQENAAQKVKDYHLGGYILFGRDFKEKTKDQVIADIQSYQDASVLPLFIAVDEEGGTVNRVSLNPQLRSAPFLSSQELYAGGGFELIRSDTEEKCQLLLSLGINLNFAPVCDISINENDFIYHRSFGQNASLTSEYVKTITETMKTERIGSVLKHFPGYGNNADTHTGIAYDNRPSETFETSDFLPFQAGIDAGADLVLVSHNIVACMDDHYPASLSPKVHEILRNKLGFSGVIVTDELAMNGIRDFVSDDKAAVTAVLAGNDLLCCTDFETQLPAVLEAVNAGTIPEARIDESVLRILKLKIKLGLIE